MAIITANSEQDTEKAAQDLAATLQAGDILCLYGDLGAGKTVFARALVRKLAGNAALAVPSPTFTLVQTYETPVGAVWHFDLYRIEQTEDIYELGWDEALAGGITIVEWPERLGPLLPESAYSIQIEGTSDAGSRRIVIEAPSG